jgi:hypothetical protein
MGRRASHRGLVCAGLARCQPLLRLAWITSTDARCTHTIDAFLYFLLNCWIEDLSLSPNFNNPPDLVLCLRRRALIGCLCRIGEDGFEGPEKLFLLAHFGCLGDFCVDYEL